MSTSPLGLFDDHKYALLAADSAPRYQGAAPFPHIAFDEFLNPGLAKELAATLADCALNGWVRCDNKNARKKYQHDETMLPALLRETLREFNSRQFILFLETLTGIGNLLPDPYHIGGGAHIAECGDFLKVHADFNWHDKLQAHRRVNVLLYLNENWQKGWRGELELWDKAMTGPIRTFAPILNRAVVFNTDENSNHGHPEPLSCPEGTRRRTLNLYYYTARRNESEIHSPHYTLYKTAPSPFAKEIEEKYRRPAGA